MVTWSGVDLIDHNNEFYIGTIGVYGSRAANFTVQNSDLMEAFRLLLQNCISMKQQMFQMLLLKPLWKLLAVLLQILKDL